METGLFGIQAEHLRNYRQTRQLLQRSQDVVHAVFERADVDNRNSPIAGGIKSDDPAIEFARCFLRLANLPNFALDRLSRYEAMLWRQAVRILFALHALDRRKPQERKRRVVIPADRLGPNIDFANYIAGASSLADDS
jgi:hypothetical protein